MRQNYPRFQEENTEIISMGAEKLGDFKSFWQKQEIPYIGVPDPQQKVLKLYGQEVNILKLGRMPAQFLIDQQQVLQLVHYGESMSDITADEVVLDLLGKTPEQPF